MGWIRAEPQCTSKVWLVTHAKAKVQNKPNQFLHVFGQSNLLRRAAFPQFQQALGRDCFKNWTVPLGFEGSGSCHRNKQIEQKQWFSGESFHFNVLTSLLQDSKLASNNRVLIAEGILYDDEFAAAALRLNSSEHVQMPQVGYIGVSWAADKMLLRPAGVKHAALACMHHSLTHLPAHRVHCSEW